MGVVRTRPSARSLLYGSGGTLVELLSDVAFRLHPLTDTDAAAMLEEVRGTALLRGYRGAPRADEAALRDLILRVSALVEACPEVREMDLNPVKVLTRGVQVLDARIRIERRRDATALEKDLLLGRRADLDNGGLGDARLKGALKNARAVTLSPLDTLI